MAARQGTTFISTPAFARVNNWTGIKLFWFNENRTCPRLVGKTKIKNCNINIRRHHDGVLDTTELSLIPTARERKRLHSQQCWFSRGFSASLHSSLSQTPPRCSTLVQTSKTVLTTIGSLSDTLINVDRTRRGRPAANLIVLNWYP